MSIPKKSVVTGGKGFIGSHLVKALLERGDEVHVVDIDTTDRFPVRLDDRATYHTADVRDVAQLGSIFAGATHVYHLAALPRVQYSLEHPTETTSANVGGTVAVLEAAERAGVARVVFASSSSIYGDTAQMPLGESMPPRPISPYARQKYQSEQWCQDFAAAPYNLATVCLRFFNVYGPHADPHGAYALVVAKFIEHRVKGEPMPVTNDGTQTRDFTHISDVVRAMMLAAESPHVGKGEVINIGGGKGYSVNEVAALIGGPTNDGGKRLEPHDTLADTTLAKQLLGWEPQEPFPKGIAELKKLHGLQ